MNRNAIKLTLNSTDGEDIPLLYPTPDSEITLEMGETAEPTTFRCWMTRTSLDRIRVPEPEYTFGIAFPTYIHFFARQLLQDDIYHEPDTGETDSQNTLTVVAEAPFYFVSANMVQRSSASVEVERNSNGGISNKTRTETHQNDIFEVILATKVFWWPWQRLDKNWNVLGPDKLSFYQDTLTDPSEDSEDPDCPLLKVPYTKGQILWDIFTILEIDDKIQAVNSGIINDVASAVELDSAIGGAWVPFNVMTRTGTANLGSLLRRILSVTGHRLIHNIAIHKYVIDRIEISDNPAPEANKHAIIEGDFDATGQQTHFLSPYNVLVNFPSLCGETPGVFRLCPERLTAPFCDENPDVGGDPTVLALDLLENIWVRDHYSLCPGHGTKQYTDDLAAIAEERREAYYRRVKIPLCTRIFSSLHNSYAFFDQYSLTLPFERGVRRIKITSSLSKGLRTTEILHPYTSTPTEMWHESTRRWKMSTFPDIVEGSRPSGYTLIPGDEGVLTLDLTPRIPVTFVEVLSYSAIIAGARWRYYVQPGSFQIKAGDTTSATFDACWVRSASSTGFYTISSDEIHNVSAYTSGGEGSSMTNATRKPIPIGAVRKALWNGSFYILGDFEMVDVECQP